MKIIKKSIKKFITDMVIPNGNEKEFIKTAEALGYNELCFLYELKNYPETKFETKLNIFYGIICNPEQIKHARKLSNLVVVPSKNDRIVVEKYKPDLIFGFELNSCRGFIHLQASGMNHITARLMKQNNTGMLIGFSAMLNNLRASLPRIRQNIKLCKKYKTNFVIASLAKRPFEMRNPEDMMSLFATLGFQHGFVEQGFSNAFEIYLLNARKKSPSYICEGVEVVEHRNSC